MKRVKFFITIIACLIVTVTGIIRNTPMFILSIRLIITIIVFLIIGGLLEAYLKKKVFYYDNINNGKKPLTSKPKNEENI